MPKGLKPVRKRLATGETRLYWYHRATGKRLKHDPETADGLLEVKALDDKAKVQTAISDALSGSYATLWADYIKSPEWRALKPRTRSDYQAVRDWLGDAATKRKMIEFTPKSVYAMRDKAAMQRGRRFGNYVVQVLRLTFGWGKARDICLTNPAEAVKQIRRPANARHVNRAWTWAEVEAFAADAPVQLLVPFALALFGCMRQGDALMVTWAAYDGSSLRWVAGKNGEACNAPVGGIFKTILDQAKAHRGTAVQIALNSYGCAWSASGFRASFFKRLRDLKGTGAVQPGCTYHGLRHTIAAFARDGEESEFRISAALGDRTTAMAAVYGRDADRERAQRAILGSVQKRFANSDWKLRPR